MAVVARKEALWSALAEYPDAKKRLIEKGRQLLMKDRLLEDWAMSGEAKEEIDTEQRIKNMELIEADWNTSVSTFVCLSLVSVSQSLVCALSSEQLICSS